MQLPAALFFDVIAQLIRQACGFGARPTGIGENMDMTETDLLDEVKALLPFLLGLPGEADDNIGGDIKVRDLRPQLADDGGKFFSFTAPCHTSQHGVRAALQGQMQMRHQARIVEQLKKIVRQFPRLQRT